MAFVDYAQMHVSNNTGTENDDRMRFPFMDGNSNTNKFDDCIVKPPSEALLSYDDCELPEIPKTTNSGQYFEFEQIANGIDGYFDENSDTDDENFGGNEDDSFIFNMCRIRRFQRSSKSPPEIHPCKRLGNGRTTHHIDTDEICKEVEEEGLDPEDVLCIVREGYIMAPPLAQEDDFDDVDV
ncbi:DNA polymerase II subunit [Dirofilaria immitis]